MSGKPIVDSLKRLTGRDDWEDLAFVLAAAAVVGGSAGLLFGLG